MSDSPEPAPISPETERQICLVLTLKRAGPDAPEILDNVRLEIPGHEIKKLTHPAVADLDFMLRVCASEIADRGMATGVVFEGANYT